MKYYYFYSKFGYNDTIREGKMYHFTSNETLRYVIEINIDLVAISVKLNYLLRPYLRRYLDAKRNILKLNTNNLWNVNETVKKYKIYI